MRLQDRVAVVTGAASGIGRAIATRFADEGAIVVVSDLREQPLEGGTSTVELIRSRGGRCEFVKTDITNGAEVDELIGGAVSRHGRLDVLVNNAAVFNSTAILDTTEEDWDSLMAVNLRGTFLCCKRAITQMLEQSENNEVRGRIINLSSQHGMVGPPEFFSYGVSKGGIVNMTRQLAVDYGRRGIIVNAVAPGRIFTGTHPHEDDMSHSANQYSLSRTPFSRLGRPEDVAGAALFLASDDASFISGINLLVDGGWMAY